MKIEINLKDNFVQYLQELMETYGDELAKINGIAPSQLNYTTFIDNFIDAPAVTDGSIDESANLSLKDIRSLLDEKGKPHDKLIAYNKIFYEMEKEYGVEEAREWLKQEYTKGLYLHDASTSTYLPYCYNYDLHDLFTRGLYFLPKTNTAPANHLTTFMAHIREFIVFVSNRSSGACSLASFFIYTFYRWKKDVEEGYFLRDPEYYRRQIFQQFIFECNQIHTRITQSAYTNLTIMDQSYLVELFGSYQYPDGTYAIDYIDEIIEHQKVFLEVVAETRKSLFLTFPVISYALLFQDGKFVNEEFARWCSDNNLDWYDKNFFNSGDITHVCSCCRLKNDLSKQRQFQSSIGGSLTEIGSVKVSTINLMRIALESNGDKEKYIEILKARTILNMKALDRIRHIIKRNIEKGLLPNYSYGLITLEKQTCTNGITAMQEVIEEMGMLRADEFGNISYSKEGDEFACLIMDTINELQDNAPYDYNFSMEVIPGESANIKLCKADNLLYGRSKDYIYSNQWIGLTEKATLEEKIRLSAMLDDKAGGGQILHIQIGAPLEDKEYAWNLLNKIVAAGVIYFAFNARISLCPSSHSFYGEVCPVCGEKKSDEAAKIVGYTVPVSKWSKDRQREYFDRKWETQSRLKL